MELSTLTEGLEKLLEKNFYNEKTIDFYRREWKKLGNFLISEYGDQEFNMERGLNYLDHQYDFRPKYEKGTLSQQRVQLLRVIQMLEDFRVHGVLTRRIFASKNPISLPDDLKTVHDNYCLYLENSDSSKCTCATYGSICLQFLDYLNQKEIAVTSIDFKVCEGYINTLAGFSFKTIEQKICGLRHFLRYLNSVNIVQADIASKIHMAPISKSAKIPSCYTSEELKSMLTAVDRNNPIGKRDYAMLVLACILGLRSGDIKNLRFENFDWEKKELSFIQHKTNKPLTLPLPSAVGWAVIDYVKNARPACQDIDYVFVKHMPPFDQLSDDNHLYYIVTKYMRKAGINNYKNRRSGFHSLRHSAATQYLEMETPLPVISTILGHSDVDITGVYLKTDLEKLAECVLDLGDIENGC